MKKIAIIILIIISICMFTACNYQLVDLNYKYTNALIKIGEKWMDVEIKAWRDYDGEQIQLTLEDETILLVCSVNCILYNGELPKTNITNELTEEHLPMNDFEQHIVEKASTDLKKESEGATLQLIYTEYVGFVECNVHTYVITFSDGSKYIARAREDEDGYFCSVGKL